MAQFPGISEYFDILNKSQKLYTRCLEPVCRKWDLTRSELDVLLFLYNNPEYRRAADIVEHRGMAKSHVSLSVTGLENRGLLQRQFSQKDRRAAHLMLTDPAKEIAAEGRNAQLQFFEGLYSGISQEDYDLWRGITRQIFGNIETLEQQLEQL